MAVGAYAGPMDFSRWSERAQEGAQLHEQGHFDEAAAVWRELVDEPQARELDCAMLLGNLGITLAAAGRLQEAEGAHDAAVRLEEPLLRGSARSRRADFHARQGRVGVAVAAWRDLAAQPWSTWAERISYAQHAEEWERYAAQSGSPQGAPPTGAPPSSTTTQE